MVSAKAIGRRRKAIQQVVKECISKSLKVMIVVRQFSIGKTAIGNWQQ